MYRTNWKARPKPLPFPTAALSSAGIATAVTVIGAFASVPIGGVAAITGISSTLLTGFSKKLQHKLAKHEKLCTLAVTKKNTVTKLVSKALNDNKISDNEFNLVLRELEKRFMNSKPSFARRAQT